jgi:hypothetical protein
LDQFISFLEVLGDRFLQKDIDPSEKKVSCDGVVEKGRDRDAYGLNLIEKIRVLEEGLSPVSLRNFSCPGGIDIHHSDQIHPFHLGIFFCMELAEVTDTDDAHLDLLHLTAYSSLRLLDEMEEMLYLWYPGDFILSDLLHRFVQRQAGPENDAISLFQDLHGLI